MGLISRHSSLEICRTRTWDFSMSGRDVLFISFQLCWVAYRQGGRGALLVGSISIRRCFKDVMVFTTFFRVLGGGSGR
jgi:hypothetical protein